MCVTEMATFSFYAGSLNTSPLIKQKHTAYYVFPRPSKRFLKEGMRERERMDFFRGMYVKA